MKPAGIKTAWWLGLRYFGSWRQFFSLPILLSLIGMMIGVGSLVVSMAVFSGYTATLERTVQDAVGHILVFKKGSNKPEELLKEIEPMVDDLVAATPFVYSEAVIAGKGKIGGVVIEGVEAGSVHKVLNLKSRLIEGVADVGTGEDGIPTVLIGKGIAKKFELKPGDMLNLVVPLTNEFQANRFRPKLGKFKVAGVINYGRYDFDARYVIMELLQVQSFVELGDRVTGFRLKIKDPSRARQLAMQIVNDHSPLFWARDWQEVNRNLFEAVKLEKAVLFFILMILVVAAAFNIANTLFMGVVQRYRDISVLKTLGAPNSMIRQIFIFQGLVVGFMGSLAGIALGLGLCQIFEWAQGHWQIIPPDVYKLDHIDLEVRFLDLLGIVGSSLFVSLIATWVPSKKGSRITPIEGLRYD